MYMVPLKGVRIMRPSLLTGKPDNHFDHVVMTRRFQEFSGTSRNKPFRRRLKSALKRQLSDFLTFLSPSNCVPYCTLDVIIKFLISRDKLNITVVHTQSCSRVGCYCLTHSAASLPGMLWTIFNNIDRLYDSV